MVSQSRYREARTLVRRLIRLPGEDPADFRRKIKRLHVHFERFNIDVSELCQWLMRLRRQYGNPDIAGSFGTLGDFILEPDIAELGKGEKERDKWRLLVFDDIAGIRSVSEIAGRPIPQILREAMEEAKRQSETHQGQRIFERVGGLEPAHRLVLLKAAAEWVVARYKRCVENWQRQHTEWKKEKHQWENQHPKLTEDIRSQWTDIFRKLKDTEEDGREGIRRKNPRICLYERLKENKNNCIYAGEKGHGPLCWKYDRFVKAQKGRKSGFREDAFPNHAAEYLKNAVYYGKPGALQRLYQRVPGCKKWFEDAWKEYLKTTGLAEDTLRRYGRLPHCLKIGGKTYEKSECEWNPHTDLCKKYKQAVSKLDDATLALEKEYRQWRKLYLAGPRKPSFQCPSSRELPMPKIFGEGFHEIDFEKSILRLRLDGMGDGEWVEFGFMPWPKNYRPSRDEAKGAVTSVHVNFVGAKARAGFRFDVEHQSSRFGCTQDELDELRSRKFPRQAQDEEFLEAARKRLMETFAGKIEQEMRVLAVDLGETGACASVYQGRTFKEDIPLKIVKVDELYMGLMWQKKGQKSPIDENEAKKKDIIVVSEDDAHGLRKEHVGRHLKKFAEESSKAAEHRQKSTSNPAAPQDHDFRGLQIHVKWMIRDWARHNASQIMKAAEENKCDLIVFESQRGFRLPGYEDMNFKKKQRLAMFLFGRIRRKVTEKAVERGMRVVTVPYYKSSRVCSVCGHEQRDYKRFRNNKDARIFECECGDKNVKDDKKADSGCRCGARLDSDANAAHVLGRVFWGEIRLPRQQD